MAEIKSSIELAMERTKGLTFSEEERRKWEEEREQRLAQALVSQYLRGEVSLGELERKRRDCTDAGRMALDRALVQGLSLGMESFEPAMEALENWLGKGNRTALQRLKSLSMEWGQALQKRRRKIKAELRAELASRGVGGSAVEPHVEGSPLWEKALQELRGQFQGRFLEIQELLLKALSNSGP
jgi:hypothetical protein